MRQEEHESDHGIGDDTDDKYRAGNMHQQQGSFNTDRQESSGNRTVVTERSASVMTQKRAPPKP
jgi:hypothetical protein